MATGAMFMGGAAYNNGIAPMKNYIFGEAYTRKGEPAKIVSPTGPDGKLSEKQEARGVLAELYQLPTWHVITPADIFRVFERGGRTINAHSPETGLPTPPRPTPRLADSGRPQHPPSSHGPPPGT